MKQILFLHSAGSQGSREESGDFISWLKIENVVFVGHSLGGSVLLKYLAANHVHFTIIGLYLCASPFWGKDTKWQYQPFTLSPDFVKHLPPINNLHIYHSIDDLLVPFRHAELYRDDLPDSILHEIPGDSHAFDNGIERLPQDIRNANK